MTWSSETGNTTARGYGAVHQRARKAALRAMRDGDPCARCGGPMFKSQALHLDHTDDRTGYNGLVHARCNRLAAARKGGRASAPFTPLPWHSEPLRTSRAW